MLTGSKFQVGNVSIQFYFSCLYLQSYLQESTQRCSSVFYIKQADFQPPHKIIAYHTSSPERGLITESGAQSPNPHTSFINTYFALPYTLCRALINQKQQLHFSKQLHC